MKKLWVVFLTLFFITGCKVNEESGVEPTFQAVDYVEFPLKAVRPDWTSEEFVSTKVQNLDVQVLEDNVNFEEVGEYEVVLMATVNENETKDVIVVSIKDTVAPYISDRPTFPDVLIIGDPTPDWNTHISVYDAYEGRILITDEMVTTDLDTSKVGSYEVTFESRDSSGNVSKESYRIKVVEPYVITLDDVEYVETDRGYVLLEYTNTRENRIEIPSEIDGVPVYSIYDQSFRAQGLLRLILNEGLSIIGNRAFESNKLENVTIPNTVESIGVEAFAQNNITRLNMSPTVKVEREAFNDNEIAWINNEPSNGIIYGFGETFDTTRIVSYGGASEVIDFIPETVRTIDNGAFMQSNITEVVIPNSVEYIGEMGFAFNEITSLTLPEQVVFGASVFIGNTINLLNGNAFDGIIYDRLQTGEINTKAINSYVGVNKDVVIPDGVESIEVGAFQSVRLQSLIIPESVQKIGAYAFAFNSTLESVQVLGQNPERLAYGLVGYGFDDSLNFKFNDIEEEGNTLVVFVSFDDYEDFEMDIPFGEFYDLFKGDVSLENYISEISYDQFDLNVQFLGEDYHFYYDDKPMGYYMKQTDENPLGYETLSEEENRLNELFFNMVEWVDNQGLIENGEVLDLNDDGAIDNLIMFHLGEGEWGDILWPKQGLYFGQNVSIAGKEVLDISMLTLGQPNAQSPSTLSVYAHEYLHLLGAADYYQYGEPFESSLRSWEIMASGSRLVHPTQYVKEKYLGFDIDTIETDIGGTFTLSNTLNENNNAIKINLKKANEDIFIEYRVKSIYDMDLPDSGIIVYRVNSRYYGNTNGVYNESMLGIEEIHVYRPSDYLEEYLLDEKYILKPIDEYSNGPFAYHSEDAAMNLSSYQAIGTGTDVKMYYSNGAEIPLRITLDSMTEESAVITIEFTGEQ